MLLHKLLWKCVLWGPSLSMMSGLYHATDPPHFLCTKSFPSLFCGVPLPPTSGPFKSGVLYRKSVLWFSETTFCLRIFGSNGVFKGEDPGHLDKVKVPFSCTPLRSLDSVISLWKTQLMPKYSAVWFFGSWISRLPPKGVIFKEKGVVQE